MNKKVLFSALFLLSFCFVVNTPVIAAEGSTPLRASLWPSAGQVPEGLSCKGFSFGIVTFGDKTRVVGLDLGFISLTKYVKGAQISFYNCGDDNMGCQFGGANVTGYIDGTQIGLVNSASKEVKGSQVGLVNVNKKVNGVQIGLYNTTDNTVSGPQIGIINVGKAGKGIQIGLINILENGFVKVFPIINMSVSKD